MVEGKVMKKKNKISMLKERGREKRGTSIQGADVLGALRDLDS
jgi:hypothetical protein